MVKCVDSQISTPSSRRDKVGSQWEHRKTHIYMSSANKKSRCLMMLHGMIIKVPLHRMGAVPIAGFLMVSVWFIMEHSIKSYQIWMIYAGTTILGNLLFLTSAGLDQWFSQRTPKSHCFEQGAHNFHQVSSPSLANYQIFSYNIIYHWIYHCIIAFMYACKHIYIYKYNIISIYIYGYIWILYFSSWTNARS